MSEIIFTLVLVGVGLYLLNEFVPMDAKIKKLVNVLVVLAVLLWLLEGFGLVHAPSFGWGHHHPRI